MAAFTVRGLTCTVIACLLLLAPTSEAITCGMVVSSLSSCLPYVLGKAPTPSGACCGGIKGLYAAARLPADRRAVCTCLKGFAGQLSGVNYGLVGFGA